MIFNLDQRNPHDNWTISGRIPSLDGLRGIAILMVILGHGYYSFPLPSYLAILSNGRLGVKIFFVLSGFLIYNLTIKELRSTGSFDWRHFYLRRVLRIFPCFYFYFFAILALSFFGPYVLGWPMLLGAGTFTLNYRHLWDQWSPTPSDYPVIGQYWTLALEEQFYLFWPLLVHFICKGSLQSLLIIAILSAPIIRIITYFLMPDSRGQLLMMAHTGFDSIAVGVLLGELMVRTKSRQLLTSFATKPWLLYLSLIILCFISPAMAQRFGGTYSVTFGATIDLIAIASLILVAVKTEGTLLFRFLNWRPLMFIGTLSYSLYVWNPLFLYQDSPIPLNYAPWNFIFAFAASLLSHFAIERPFLRLKDRIGTPRTASGPSLS